MSSTSEVGSIRALCGSLLGITTITCGLRFYARYVQGAGFGPDDWLIIPAFLSFIGMTVVMLAGVNMGYWGSTDQEVAVEHIPFFSEVALIITMDIVSVAALGFTRMSALFFYRRVFAPRGHSRKFRNILYVSLAIVTLWTVIFIIVAPLQCPYNLWGAPPAARTAAGCSAYGTKLVLGFSISDLPLEVWVIALPIPNILRLQTSMKRRFAVLFVFLTALVSLGANAARLGITYQQVYGSSDKTKLNTTSYFIWTLEAGFAIIAVNLPSLWWIKQKVKPESVLKSIRSTLSLQSIRSRTSHGSGNQSTQNRVDGESKLARKESNESSEADQDSAASREQV